MLNLNKRTKKLNLNLNQRLSLRSARMSVVHNITQNSCNNFLSYLSDNHNIAQMMSTEGTYNLLQ